MFNPDECFNDCHFFSERTVIPILQRITYIECIDHVPVTLAP